MAQLMSESRLIREGVLSISLEGRVDLTTVPGIRKRLLGFAKKGEVRRIHLDLSQVTLLDTSGVAMLVEIRRWLARKGGVLRLTGASENIWRLIQLARLDQVFEVGDDPDRRI